MCFSWLNHTLIISTSLKVGNFKCKSQHLPISLNLSIFSLGFGKYLMKVKCFHAPWQKRSRVHGCSEVEWLMEYVPKAFLEYSFLGAGPCSRLQRVKQKAQVTLCPSREVREAPDELSQPPACPGTGSDSQDRRRGAQGAELNQHSPTRHSPQSVYGGKGDK